MKSRGNLLQKCVKDVLIAMGIYAHVVARAKSIQKENGYEEKNIKLAALCGAVALIGGIAFFVQEKR